MTKAAPKGGKGSVCLIWQDIVAIISLIIGALGFGFTIWSLVNTGLIKKAVNKTHNELMNKFKFATHRNTYLNSIKKVKKDLSSFESTCLSSDSIRNISFDMDGVVKWLTDCYKHFSDKDKKKVEQIAKRLNEINNDKNIIFDNLICNELRSFSQDLSLLLEKEDYYL